MMVSIQKFLLSIFLFYTGVQCNFEVASSQEKFFQLDSSDFESKPLQLVRKNERGDLEVVKESLEHLRNLDGEFETIGVVGTFHTGKSFLLNQLMGRMKGFEIGPTVEPTTEGVWVHSVPMKEKSGMQVLFLDTEGLSAPGNTADYDAKIFAISTLLSSHLIYNSVKIIDEAAMEYLQILSRRAQLFALKTVINNTSGNNDNKLDSMITFPPLTWVVEDFFQEIPDGASPTEWLHGLLQRQKNQLQSDQSGDNTVPSLDSIFPDTSCHTLFLPASTKEDLKHLDMLDGTKLNRDYLEDVRKLVNHLVTKLRIQAKARDDAKDSNSNLCSGERLESSTGLVTPGFASCSARRDTRRTGPAIAMLVEVLVAAANGGSMSAMPKMWSLFLERQAEEARGQALIMLKKEIKASNTEAEPVTKKECKDNLVRLSNRALHTYRRALFGVSHAISLSQEEVLKRDIEEAIKGEEHAHGERIRKFVGDEIRRDLDKFEKRVGEINIPVQSKKLRDKLNELSDEHSKDMVKLIVKYGADQEEKDYPRMIKDKADKRMNDNAKELEEMMRKAQTRALKTADNLYKTILDGKYLRGEAEMSELEKQATEEATSTWAHQSELAAGENNFKQFRGSLENDLRAKGEAYRTKNQENIRKFCQARVKELQQRMKKALRVVKLPMEISEEENAVASERLTAVEDFDRHMAKFKSTKVYTECRKGMATALEDFKDKLKEQNNKETKQLVHKPLQAAKQRIQDMAPSFWCKVTFDREAKRIASEKIGNKVSEAMKARVVGDWLEKDVASYSPSGLWVIFCFPLNFLAVITG